jgi:hypothetical protein
MPVWRCLRLFSRAISQLRHRPCHSPSALCWQVSSLTLPVDDHSFIGVMKRQTCYCVRMISRSAFTFSSGIISSSESAAIAGCRHPPSPQLTSPLLLDVGPPPPCPFTSPAQLSFPPQALRTTRLNVSDVQRLPPRRHDAADLAGISWRCSSLRMGRWFVDFVFVTTSRPASVLSTVPRKAGCA